MNVAPSYYSLLGVSASDDLEHITKAYKKLAKKYHPDTSLLPKREAEEKFKAISAAYRLARLAKTGLQRPEIYPGNPSSTDAKPTPPPPSAGSASAGNQDPWITFCARNRRAKHLHDELARISPTLSEEFRYAVLADGSSDGLEEIASILEEEYLSKYFGANPKVQRLAKWLIMSANVALAVKLNGIAISGKFPKNIDKFILEFIVQHGLNYTIPDDAATDSRDTVDFILDISSQIGIFGSFFVISVLLSFTLGVLTASLFTNMHLENGALLICSEVFVLCLAGLAIMFPMLVKAARRHQSSA